MGSGNDNPNLNVICDADGLVVFQAAPSRRGDDEAAWSSEAPTAVGRPLVKTYWFDHLDCDGRELQQIIRKAATGRTERVRVWLRVSEQQLIRAEFTASPLLDASGQVRHVLVRTEATQSGIRRRDSSDSENLRTVRSHETPATDLLALRLAVPLLRLDLETGTVLDVNDALADLLERRRDECTRLPLSELVDPHDRRTATEAITNLAGGPNERFNDRPLELHLINASGQPIYARLALAPDPVAQDGSRTVIVVIRDLSAERRMAQLMERADQVAQVSLDNSKWLERLEKLIDAAPVGLALYEDGQLLRSNRAFDRSARPGEADSWVDDLVRRAADSQSVERHEKDGDAAVGFWLASDDRQLVGAAITSIGQRHRDAATALTALTRALRDGRQTEVYRVDAERRIVRLDDDAAASVPSVLSDDAQSEFDAACDEARSTRSTLRRSLDRTDGRRCEATVVPVGTEELLLVLEDPAASIEQLTLLNARIEELEALAYQLKQEAPDPAELQRLARANAEQVDRQRVVLGALGAGSVTWDIEAGRLDADATSLEHFGFDSSADPPSTPAELTTYAQARDREAFEQALFDAMSPEGPGRLDVTLHIGDEARAVRIAGSVLFADRDGARDPERLIAVALDASNQHRTTARLDELQAMLHLRTAELNALLETSADWIRIYHDGVIRQNPAAASALGDASASAFTAADDTPPARALAGEATSSERSVDVGGSTRVIASSATPVLVDGKVVGAVAIERDVSDVRDLEARLRVRDEEIAGLFANTGVGILYIDAAGLIIDANAQLSALLGHSRADLVGRRFSDITSTDDQPTMNEQFRAVLAGERTSCSAEVRLLRRGDVETWTQITIAPRHTDGDRSVVALVQDANEVRVERVRAADFAAALETLRKRYALFQSTATDGFVLLDGSLNILDANDAARKLLRLSEETNLSKLQFTTPDGSSVIGGRHPWNRAARGKPNTQELIVHFDDTSVPLEIEATPGEDRTVALRIKNLSSRKALQEELQKTYARVVEAHTMLQQRTQQFEGNLVSAVQQLGAAIAQAIPTAKSLSTDARLPSDLRSAATRLIDAFRVHDRLVQHYTDSAVTGAASGAKSVRSEVDFHAIVHEAIRLVTSRFNVGGRLKTHLDATSTACRLDAAILTHACWSLFAHAASQASRAQAIIRTENGLADDGSPRVVLSVTWPGKSSNTAEIALARHFAEAEGGSLDIDSADDMTTARLALPLAAQPTAALNGMAPRRVLLLEDHDSTARVLARQLTRLRCEVTAVSTLQAGRKLLDDGAAFELLVCDLTMPDGDAMAFMRDATKPRDGATPPRGIALRGYTAGADDPMPLRTAGVVETLTKPVDLAALSAAIERLSRIE